LAPIFGAGGYKYTPLKCSNTNQGRELVCSTCLRINERLAYKRLTEQYRFDGEKKILENSYLKLYADGKIKSVRGSLYWKLPANRMGK